MEALAERIIRGERLDRRDDLSMLVELNLETLCRAADQVRRALCGDRGELCTIVNGRSGRCSEDCRFCAQSCHYHTQAEEYPFLPVQEIVEEGKRNEAAGVHRYSIVTAGRGSTAGSWTTPWRPTAACGRRPVSVCVPPTAFRPGRSFKP